MVNIFISKSYQGLAHMTRVDRTQFRDYCRRVDKIESPAHTATKAVQYVREDREIADINHHLTTLDLN